MNISVAMATYNGEKFISEQIESILCELGENDELIISDDNSSDTTREIVSAFINKDSRIKLINGPCKGIVRNFENAIKNCNNEIILLCDQDDIWDANKVETLLNCFEKSNADLILHNARINYEDNSNSCELFFEKRGCKKGIFNNILKNSYIGCCMAFKSSMRKYFLPFPEKIPMHDQWIGIMCEKYGKVELLDTPLITYRRHNSNASGETPSSIFKRVNWRISLIANIIKRNRKIKKGEN